MTKVSSFEKRVFQEAYQVTGLSVFDLQLIIAPVMSIFEPRVKDLDRMWRDPKLKGFSLKEGSSVKEKQKEMIRKRKDRLMQRAQQFGRLSITRPWYATDGIAISKDRCNQLVKNFSKPDREKETCNISVRIIRVELAKSAKLKLLVLMEGRSKLLSILPYRRLSSTIVLSKINAFLRMLNELKIVSKEIRLISDDGSSKYLKKVKPHFDYYTKRGISVVSEKIGDSCLGEQISLNVEESVFEKSLGSKLIAYNIGIGKKRTRSFIVIQEHLKRRRQRIRGLEDRMESMLDALR